MTPISSTGSRLKAVDLFCGCGGSSTGAASVPGIEITHAFNHWERAVESHAANHPATDTALTDLFEVHPAAFPRMDILLASPECRTHSPASGTRRKNLGQVDLFDRCDLSPEKVKSRATMWTVAHWTSVHRPEAVVVENVVEIHYWPEFRAWIRDMRNLGYEYECVYLNAMHVHGLTDQRVHFMAPQSRDRIYVVFWRRGNPRPDLDLRPSAYCEACAELVGGVQVWKDTPQGRQRWGRYRRQYEYACPACASMVEPFTFAAANAIDWSLPGIRIGDREKHGLRPLSEKTMARIRYGLEKFGLHPYTVVNRYSSGVECRVGGVDEALPTQPSQPVVGLVETAYSHAPDSRVRTVDHPLPTQSTRNTQALIFANRTNGVPVPATSPMHAVTTGQTLGLITALRTNGRTDPVERAPMPTVTAGGNHHGLLTDPYRISPAAQLTLRGTRSLDGLDDTLGVVVASAQQIGLLSRHPFLIQYYGSLNASSALEALPVVTTQDRHGLVDGGGEDVDIEDLCFRMLEPHELKVGTGHPSDYILAGTKRDRVKLVGNSNFPGCEEWLVSRLADTLAA